MSTPLAKTNVGVKFDDGVLGQFRVGGIQIIGPYFGPVGRAGQGTVNLR